MFILIRNLIAILAITFVLAFSADASLVSYWSFDTDASDFTSAHDGTLVNGAAISIGNQGFGGGEALSLAGGNQHMSAANPTALDFNSDFTWVAYVKTTSGGAGAISRSQLAGNWNQGSKALFLEGGRVEFDTGWVGNPNTGVVVNDDQWHQIVVTYVAATDQLDIFVDATAGTTNGQFSGGHDVKRFDEHSHVHNGGVADTDFRIGWVSPNFQSTALNGLIDEVAVFDTALSGSDLKQLFESGPASFAIPEPGWLVLLGLGGLVFLKRRLK